MARPLITNATKTRSARCERALKTAALVVGRYEGTPFEMTALRIFQRLEETLEERSRLADVKSRALALRDRSTLDRADGVLANKLANILAN